MTETQKRFERDIANHRMTIVRDDDVNRHLMCRDAGGGSPYWFEIVTWPGTLCIRGDMGTYVFSRERDMLGFFRASKYGREGEPGKLYIDPAHWAAKLKAADSNGGHPSSIKELDRRAFNKQTMDQLNAYMGIDDGDCDYPGKLVTEIRRDLRGEVLDAVHDSTPPNEAHRILHDYIYRDNKDCMHHPFWDTESVPTNYTFHFLWCLYAIAWAVREYDAAKAAAEPASEAAAA